MTQEHVISTLDSRLQFLQDEIEQLRTKLLHEAQNGRLGTLSSISVRLTSFEGEARGIRKALELLRGVK